MPARIDTRFAWAMALLVSCTLSDAAHSQTITMGSALQRALAASPRLTAVERDIGIARGRRIQSGTLRNPELSYEQDNSFGSGIYRGTRSAESTLQISQMFELWGKRDPISRLRTLLETSGMDGPELEARAAAAADRVAAAFRSGVQNMPDPEPITVFDNVYAEPHHELDRQKNEYARYLEGFTS